MNTHAINRLVFSTYSASQPAAGTADLVANKVREKLLELAVIQEPIIGLKDSYGLGDGFLQQIIFMGCSPAIELEVPDSIDSNELNFSFARLLHVQDLAPFHGYDFSALQQVPRCRQCRRSVAPDRQAFIDLLEASTNTNTDKQIVCRACNTAVRLAELDWRKQTAWGNIFIEIFHVYPHEAVPTDAFVQHLSDVSQTPWEFFYTQADPQFIVSK